MCEIKYFTFFNAYMAIFQCINVHSGHLKRIKYKYLLIKIEYLFTIYLRIISELVKKICFLKAQNLINYNFMYVPSEICILFWINFNIILLVINEI